VLLREGGGGADGEQRAEKHRLVLHGRTSFRCGAGIETSKE
jgi:hypothetical protein